MWLPSVASDLMLRELQFCLQNVFMAFVWFSIINCFPEQTMSIGVMSDDAVYVSVE